MSALGPLAPGCLQLLAIPDTPQVCACVRACVRACVLLGIYNQEPSITFLFMSRVR